MPWCVRLGVACNRCANRVQRSSGVSPMLSMTHIYPAQTLGLCGEEVTSNRTLIINPGLLSEETSAECGVRPGGNGCHRVC